MSTIYQDLLWRGQIKDRTFIDEEWLNDPKIFYLGTDCSSGSLQIGNLAVYMLARRLVKAGWKAVLLVGGATSLVGDPGGKVSERELMAKEDIDKNVESLTLQVSRLLDGSEFSVVNNYDWFNGMGYLEFLRDVGKHYSMTELLQRDFVSERIGEGKSGISYAEFSYSLIQGYDFYYLYSNHNVVLQIGGSDQWGNMISGVPLVRKKTEAEVHALSMPLVINKSTGRKFGKSEEGTVWLDELMTSVFKFYQFWLNCDDEGVEDYLKIYTELSKERIDEIMLEFSSNRSSRLAQKTLADEVTAIVHGTAKRDAAVSATSTLFGGLAVSEVSPEAVDMLKDELPCIKVEIGKDISDILVDSGLVSSRSEAKRLIDQGGVLLNQQKVVEDRQLISTDKLMAGSVLLQRGKNQFAVVDINV